jgi:hypothetical protein
MRGLIPLMRIGSNLRFLITCDLVPPKTNVVSVATNNIPEAVAQLGSALYDLPEQALMAADDEDESDFESVCRRGALLWLSQRKVDTASVRTPHEPWAGKRPV